MWVDIDVIDATGIEGGRPPLDPVDHITLIEQEARQKRSILPGHSSNQCDLRHNGSLRLLHGLYVLDFAYALKLGLSEPALLAT